MFLNNQQVTENQKGKKNLETNDNENMTTKNLWDATKEGSLNPTSRNKKNI